MARKIYLRDRSGNIVYPIVRTADVDGLQTALDLKQNKLTAGTGIAINNDVISVSSTIYSYKGSCKYAELPTTGQVAGDVWNVTDAHESYPAGTNYAWNGSAWSALSGNVDFGAYRTSAAQDVIDAQLQTNIDAKSVVSAAASGTSVNEVNYLTINGTEYKIGGAGGSSEGTCSIYLHKISMVIDNEDNKTELIFPIINTSSAKIQTYDGVVSALQKAFSVIGQYSKSTWMVDDEAWVEEANVKRGFIYSEGSSGIYITGYSTTVPEHLTHSTIFTSETGITITDAVVVL